MKIEPNMYVRTKDRGIAKFKGWSAYDKNKVAIHTHNEGDVEITPVIDKSTIIKASHNIIDLIEVGDYVNGSKVQEIRKNYIEIEEYSGLNNDEPCIVKSEDIKSIVTKEQFESIEYSLEG